jgi:hypothetical protein
MRENNKMNENSLKKKLSNIGEPLQSEQLTAKLTKGEADEYGLQENDILSIEEILMESEGDDA